MFLMAEPCVLCRASDADSQLDRVQVWEDDLWRLTVSLDSEVTGFSYLESKRHIPHITDLDREEAQTLGVVLARVSKALQEATRCNMVFLYVFGGHIDHLHFFLVPHKQGDAVSAQIFKGEYEIERRVGGAARWGSKDYPKLPKTELEAIAARIKEILSA